MPIVYSVSLRTTRMEDVRDSIDGGGGAGSIEICTAGYGAVIVEVQLAYPCGEVVDGVDLDFNYDGALTSVASGTGTAAAARIKDSEGNVIVDGLTVDIEDADIILSRVNLDSGDPLLLNVARLRHPPIA